MPSDVDQKDQAVYDRFSKLSGAAFDRAYARDMVRDHVKDVAAFRLEAMNRTNASIRNFASQTLPTLENHLKDARKMLQSVSPSAAIKSSAGHPGA